MTSTRSPRDKKRPSTSIPVGIVLFDAVEELDFIGPWEVFSVANRLYPGSFPTRLLSTGQSTVRARYGLNVTTLDSLYASPTPRLLMLPGGPGRQTAMKDARLLDYVKRAHAKGTLTTSVCTGAFILAAAGLLDGKSATTHWSAIEELRAYPKVRVVRRRFVDVGDVVTAAGISAGIDVSLHLVARFLGKEARRRVARTMEYYEPARSREKSHD
jgi:transcriptional regulator GlxA family with amidase domain